MLLSIIVATDSQNAIGFQNKLLWHLPADLKFFKSTTMGCPVIMGRKTFESIGRLLPGRLNVVISRNSDLKIEGAEICSDLNDALNRVGNVQNVFIIGGGEIYKQSMNIVGEIYRTKVHHQFEADTFFPEIKESEFRLVWSESHEPDEKNKFPYTFEKWERIS